MDESDVNRTLFFNASFVGATFPTNFLIEREPPHRPARLRTVVGNSGERESSSASAAPRKLDAAIGECRSWQSTGVCSCYYIIAGGYVLM